MKLYKITYQNRDAFGNDNGAPAEVCFKRAHSAEHAIDMFTDPDDLDWEILKIERVKEG